MTESVVLRTPSSSSSRTVGKELRDSVPWEPVGGHDAGVIRRDWAKCICGSFPADGLYLKGCVVHDPAKGGLPPQDVFDD